jgi:cytoskeletal protein RodZ
MQTTSETVRGPRPLSILWKWTGLSAVVHGLLVAALCGVSYLQFAKREAASKAKLAMEEAAAKKAEAEEAAKTPAPPSAGTAPATAAAGTAAPATTAPPGATAEKTATAEKPLPPPAAQPATAQQQAEKILGIDKVAKPGDTPKSPFSKSDDDLLKDLK